MLKRMGIFCLCVCFTLLIGVSMAWAIDQPTQAPAGEFDGSSEEVQDADSWITIQWIGGAPGMDQYRWGNEDFGWRHRFDEECKDIFDVTLKIRAWDVDYWQGERDAIIADGVFLGYLEGRDDRWSETEFDVPVELLADGQLRVWVDIDVTHAGAAVEIDWSQLRTHWDWSAPVADFIATSPTEGVGPLEVCFRNLSTCARQYLWDFGDGTTSTHKHPCHIFDPVQKYYTVSLTVWGCGGEDTETKANYITVFKATSVDFAATNLVGPAVSFINKSGGNANYWEWNYGDGTVELLRHSSMSHEKINPENRYPDDVKGEYDVTLAAWGQGGADTLTIPNMIYVDPDHEYLPLEFVEGGETYEGDGWDKLIDNCVVQGVAAVNDEAEAWAIFKIAPEEAKEVCYIRMLPDNYHYWSMQTNLVKEWEITLLDEMRTALWDTVVTSSKIRGEWEIVMLGECVEAEFVKIKLLSPRGPGDKKKDIFPEYIEMVELQVFGGPVSMDKRVAASASDLPASFALDQNYPNPFNPSTSIQFQLPEVSDVELVVFNLQGQLVKTLAKSQMSAGTHSVVWDATDMNGMPVAGGVYIYKIQARGESEVMNVTRKMIFMK